MGVVVGEEGAVGGVVGEEENSEGGEASDEAPPEVVVGEVEVVVDDAVVVVRIVADVTVAPVPAMLFTPGKMICEPTARSSAFRFFMYSFWSTVVGNPFNSILICRMTAFSCLSLVFNDLYFCTTNETAGYV